MKLINQLDVYQSCGQSIKEDLLEGNPVVLFAYGLSGSGKTFTVFGPDAIDAPEAWFKQPEPHDLWGIFPRLAFDVFAMKAKEEGWKITMKYFQNVVDSIRDLMAPNATEKNFKSGLKMDSDGFRDVNWTTEVDVKDWDDLREKFRVGNARKAISPTQFNHQSTRGHCFLQLIVDRPHPQDKTQRRRGRIIVCDLAGAEPAADVYHALYNKTEVEVEDKDGSMVKTMRYELVGQHKDVMKTKILQDQGKKINLSLSEMSQFFMKMAQAIKSKKLKPGGTISGCNSYFLCKYLKDTMLKAKTYLFCALRPEVSYHRYTFSTLEFGKNASVVKLQPKKAVVQSSAGESKKLGEILDLKEQLMKMKLMLAAAKKEAPAEAEGAGGAGGAPRERNKTRIVKEIVIQKEVVVEKVYSEEEKKKIAELELAMKALEGEKTKATSELEGLMDHRTENLKAKEEETKRAEKEAAKYASRGISLTCNNPDNKLPALSNVDEDAFRNDRLMFILDAPKKTFGNKTGDFKPVSMHMQDGHCSLECNTNEAGANLVQLVGGDGKTYHNGALVAKDAKKTLAPFDRIVVGDILLMFRDKAKEEAEAGKHTPFTVEAACDEYREILAKQASKVLTLLIFVTELALTVLIFVTELALTVLIFLPELALTVLLFVTELALTVLIFLTVLALTVLTFLNEGQGPTRSVEKPRGGEEKVRTVQD
jgi:hypothetical protein